MSSETLSYASAPEDTLEASAGGGGGTTGGGTRPDHDASLPERGAVVGRYVVLSKLGAGAMGVVLAAYDPRLDRKVALKLLKSSPGLGSSTSSAQARLQREAQALAKLDHPNVVGVHDVGVHEGQLFVGMDFVDGQTLRDWMRSGEAPRAWREVVSVFAAAGRGLAAAHAAGLVHRDFKPDNVMVGRDGRVRVMDFGLARTDTEAGGEADGGAAPWSGEGDREGGAPAMSGLHAPLDSVTAETLAAELTQAGALVGTPAYMSLEQLRGRPADARSDQFSFCVALYEALYGRRPFDRPSLAGMFVAIGKGQVDPPPKNTAVPTWLRRVVVRGLAPAPGERWPSMAALLSALEDDPTARRRSWLIGAALVVGLGGAIWGSGAAGPAAAGICEGMEARLEGVWDAERRGQLASAFEQTGLAYAPDTWARAAERLDDYAAAWVAQRQDACLATHRGEQSDTLLDLRMACLDERLDELDALLDALARPDEAVVEKAILAVEGLGTLDRCRDTAALTTDAPPPDDPEMAARVEALEHRLAEVQAMRLTGQFPRGLAIAGPVVTEAEALGHDPLTSRAFRQQALLQRLNGDFAEAEASMTQAYEFAVRAQLPAQAASATSDLMGLVGYDLARADDGRRWAMHAEPWASAAGTPEARANYLAGLAYIALTSGELDVARGHLEEVLALREGVDDPDQVEVLRALNNLGVIVGYLGDAKRARAYHERTLALRIELLGPDHPIVAGSYTNLGAVAKLEGNLEEARRHTEQGLSILERSVGEAHPDLAMGHTNLGAIAYEMGDFAAARKHHERALSIFEKAHEPGHPLVGNAHHNLGGVALREGDLESARAHLEKAIAIVEGASGEDHPDVALSLNVLGDVAREEGAIDEARERYTRALAINEKAYGPAHSDVATALNNLGLLDLEAGRSAVALEYFERALAINEEALGPDHHYVAYSLVGIGRSRAQMEEPGEAIPSLERALRIWTETEGGQLDGTSLAEARFVLAGALWDAPGDAGRDRKRAVEQARLAREAYASAGPRHAKSLEAVDRWLDEHAS